MASSWRRARRRIRFPRFPKACDSKRFRWTLARVLPVYLSPGDRVDVQIFVHRNERENIPRPFTKIILQNIRVFAVDQAVQRSADGTEARTVAKTVSLVVTPSQANRITTAENLGEISLIPRHPDDDQIVDDAEQDADFLLARQRSQQSRERTRGQTTSPN